MEKTSNYQLNQWEKTDRIQMEDFNSDNTKIDAALKSLSGTLSNQAATLAGKGNCSIEVFTYTGTGDSGASTPTVVKFSRKPAAFIIWPAKLLPAGTNGSYGVSFLVGQGGSTVLSCYGENPTVTGSSCWELTASWSGGTLSFYTTTTDYQGHYQMNYSQGTYLVIAFYAN
jgi:hypothetical protein